MLGHRLLIRGLLLARRQEHAKIESGHARRRFSGCKAHHHSAYKTTIKGWSKGPTERGRSSGALAPTESVEGLVWGHNKPSNVRNVSSTHRPLDPHASCYKYNLRSAQKETHYQLKNWTENDPSPCGGRILMRGAAGKDSLHQN